jgi:hypothetical protein
VDSAGDFVTAHNRPSDTLRCLSKYAFDRGICTWTYNK